MARVDWPALDRAWLDATDDKGWEVIFAEATKAARDDQRAFWDWFLSLDPAACVNGSLVTAVLRSWRGAAPVPKRAFLPMIRAAIAERNPSFNRTFVEPCARAYGRRATVKALLPFLERGTAFEKAGAANALYWVMFGEDDLGDMRQMVRNTLLRAFVENEAVDVRRAVIGKLSVTAADYPEEMRGLVARAIEIARASDDEYLQHRIEVQLGKGGPYMALPHREPR